MMLYIYYNRVREAAGRKKEPEDIIWWFQPFTLWRFGCVHRLSGFCLLASQS